VAVARGPEKNHNNRTMRQVPGSRTVSATLAGQCLTSPVRRMKCIISPSGWTGFRSDVPAEAEQKISNKPLRR